MEFLLIGHYDCAANQDGDCFHIEEGFKAKTLKAAQQNVSHIVEQIRKSGRCDSLHAVLYEAVSTTVLVPEVPAIPALPPQPARPPRQAVPAHFKTIKRRKKIIA
jgi:hypothetical protein